MRNEFTCVWGLGFGVLWVGGVCCLGLGFGGLGLVCRLALGSGLIASNPCGLRHAG